MMKTETLSNIAEALVERQEGKLAADLEVIAMSVTRRKAIKIRRLRSKINQIETYMMNSKENIDPSYKCKLEEELKDLRERLTTLRGHDYVTKPNALTPPSTITPDVVVSPVNENL